MEHSTAVDEEYVIELDQRLKDVQNLLSQEMQARAAADEKLSRQIAEIPSVPGSSSSNVEKKSSNLTGDLAELKLLLEAEVDARCAVMRRFDQELSERNTNEKSMQESLKKLQALVEQNVLSCEQAQRRLQALEQNSQGAGQTPTELGSCQALEDKVQKMLAGQGQKLEATNLQVDMFRDNVNSVAAEANKHLKRVESQFDKVASRQDLFESGVQEIVLKLSNSNSRLEKLDAFESELREIKQHHSSSSNKLAELEKLLSNFFRYQNAIRSLGISDIAGELPDEFGQMWAELNMGDGRHSEPAPRMASSHHPIDGGRLSEPTPKQIELLPQRSTHAVSEGGFFTSCSLRAAPDSRSLQASTQSAPPGMMNASKQEPRDQKKSSLLSSSTLHPVRR